MLTCPPRVITTVPSTRRARSASESASATSGCPASTTHGIAARRGLGRERDGALAVRGERLLPGMQEQPAHGGMLEQAAQPVGRVVLPGVEARQADGATAARRALVREPLAGAREVVVAGFAGAATRWSRPAAGASASNSESVRPPP